MDNQEKKKYSSIQLGLSFFAGIIIYHLVINFFFK